MRLHCLDARSASDGNTQTVHLLNLTADYAIDDPPLKIETSGKR